MIERLEVLKGDITRLDIDAIVNAANERMLGGGGVDGAIHRAAGPELLEACRAMEEVRRGVRCPTGQSRLTPGFRLKARYVVHTVGPVWSGGTSGEPDLLASCYRTTFELAYTNGVRSIAYPAISCGVYGYPASAAARVAVAELSRLLGAYPDFHRVVLVAFDRTLEEVLRAAVAAATTS